MYMLRHIVKQTLYIGKSYCLAIDSVSVEKVLEWMINNFVPENEMTIRLAGLSLDVFRLECLELTVENAPNTI